MDFFKKKVWLVFLLILVITLGCAYLSKNGNNPVSNTVNTVLSPIQSKLSSISNPVSEFFAYLSDMKNYKSENEELKAMNNELMGKIRDISEYMEENERLQKLLDITETMTDTVTVAAKVVAYDSDNWFSYVTVNKGKKDGIKISDPVITADGVLGQVTEVGRNWAKISTIINSENSVGVRIVRNGEIGIVEGDTKLSKVNKCKLAYLAANASVISGDILKTSGLGGIYPPGLMLGKIADVSKDNMGRLDYAIIEPFVDFNKLYEVIIITDWSVDSIEAAGNNNTDNYNEDVDDNEDTQSVG